MVNRYYQPLNLNNLRLDLRHFEYIKTQLDDPEKKQTFTIGNQFIDEKLSKLVGEYNCTIINLSYFHTPPGQSRVIHSDNIHLDNMSKINFVFNGNGSVMKWWKLKEKDTTPRIGILPNGIPYNYYTPDQCEHVATTELVGPTMLNTGALHSLENFTQNYRWAISFALGDENGKVLQWDDAVVRLKPLFATN